MSTSLYSIKKYFFTARPPECAFLPLCVCHAFKRVPRKPALFNQLRNTHNFSRKLHSFTSFTITPFLPSGSGMTLPKAMLSDFNRFVFKMSAACFNCCSVTALTPSRNQSFTPSNSTCYIAFFHILLYTCTTGCCSSRVQKKGRKINDKQ